MKKTNNNNNPSPYVKKDGLNFDAMVHCMMFVKSAYISSYDMHF